MLALSSWIVAPTAAAEDRLPNLRAERPSQFRIVAVNGRRLLRFTAVMHNAGAGPVEVLGRRATSHSPWTVSQVIDDDAGGERRVETGATLYYSGDGHNHWHVKRMMAYHIFSAAVTRPDDKVGFCFFDTTLRYPSLPRSPSSSHYRESWCGTRTALTSRTGISVGWGDRYQWSLPYQWVDITGLKGGEYTIRAMVDPYDYFLETNETDSCAYTRVRFNTTGTSVTVLGSGSRCLTDWEGTTFQSSIDWAFAQAITGGCDVLLYCPGASVTREQMAMFLLRAMDLPLVKQDYFTDDEGITGESSINALAATGITTGCSPTRFCPKQPVTRAQMASFLVRALDLPAPVEPDHFIDDDNSIHEPDIDSLAESGITVGCTPDRYCPTKSVTRGQMAAFLFRAFATPPPED